MWSATYRPRCLSASSHFPEGDLFSLAKGGATSPETRASRPWPSQNLWIFRARRRAKDWQWWRTADADRGLRASSARSRGRKQNRRRSLSRTYNTPGQNRVEYVALRWRYRDAEHRIAAISRRDEPSRWNGPSSIQLRPSFFRWGLEANPRKRTSNSHLNPRSMTKAPA
jgi:hypothetical protein